MARLMLRGPTRSTAMNSPAKKMANPKSKMMASPMTIIKASAPMKPSAPAKVMGAPTKQSAVPSFTERLQSMASKMNKQTPMVKDLKPEPPTPVGMEKPKRKAPVKRSAAIRKVKKVVAPKKK